jgi:hypothetical protein
VKRQENIELKTLSLTCNQHYKILTKPLTPPAITSKGGYYIEENNMKIYFNAIDKELDIEVNHVRESYPETEIDYDVNNYDINRLSLDQFDDLTKQIIDELRNNLDVCNYDVGGC